MTTIIASLKDAEKVQFGDNYYIDVFPAPPESEKDIDAFHKAFDEALELRNKIQAALEKRFTNPPESGRTIRHGAFDGMGEGTAKALAEHGVLYIEQLIELGVDGIDALPINGIGPKKAALWHAQAVEMMG